MLALLKFGLTSRRIHGNVKGCGALPAKTTTVVKHSNSYLLVVSSGVVLVMFQRRHAPASGPPAVDACFFVPRTAIRKCMPAVAGPKYPQSSPTKHAVESIVYTN